MERTRLELIVTLEGRKYADAFKEIKLIDHPRMYEIRFGYSSLMGPNQLVIYPKYHNNPYNGGYTIPYLKYDELYALYELLIEYKDI